MRAAYLERKYSVFLAMNAAPFLGHFILGEDGFDGAFVHAQAAVDARIRIDVELFGGFELRFVLARVNAIDWTNLDAGGVLHADARLRNVMRHALSSLRTNSNSAARP